MTTCLPPSLHRNHTPELDRCATAMTDMSGLHTRGSAVLHTLAEPIEKRSRICVSKRLRGLLEASAGEHPRTVCRLVCCCAHACSCIGAQHRTSTNGTSCWGLCQRRHLCLRFPGWRLVQGAATRTACCGRGVRRDVRICCGSGPTLAGPAEAHTLLHC